MTQRPRSSVASTLRRTRMSLDSSFKERPAHHPFQDSDYSYYYPPSRPMAMSKRATSLPSVATADIDTGTTASSTSGRSKRMSMPKELVQIPVDERKEERRRRGGVEEFKYEYSSSHSPFLPSEPATTNTNNTATRTPHRQPPNGSCYMGGLDLVATFFSQVLSGCCHPLQGEHGRSGNHNNRNDSGRSCEGSSNSSNSSTTNDFLLKMAPPVSTSFPQDAITTPPTNTHYHNTVQLQEDQRRMWIMMQPQKSVPGPLRNPCRQQQHHPPGPIPDKKLLEPPEIRRIDLSQSLEFSPSRSLQFLFSQENTNTNMSHTQAHTNTTGNDVVYRGMVLNARN